MPEADRDDIRKIIYQGYRIIYRRAHDYLLTSLCCKAAVTSVGQDKKPWKES